MKNIKNLMLVDDDEIFVYLTKKTISQTSLVERIKEFDNGQDALDFLKHNRENPDRLPEVILLDLNMPIMDGWQFLEEFSALKPPIKNRVRIYICTSSISPDDASRAKTMSEVTDFIIKPFTKDKLTEMIKEL
jgi:CheY-like chemotaxis protein